MKKAADTVHKENKNAHPNVCAFCQKGKITATAAK